MPRKPRDVVDAMTAELSGQVVGLSDPASELARRAVRFAAMLEDVLAECLAPYELTMADYGVLITLRSAGQPYELRPSELKDRLLMTSGGVSGVLNRLQKRGLIRRQPHPTDGRSLPVQLTKSGVAAADAVLASWTAAQRDALRAVPRDVSRSAADALRDVMLALGDHAPAAAGAESATRSRGGRTS